MLKLTCIFIGGGIGALLRYGFSGLLYRLGNGVFPLGTLGVNLLGCFLIGFLWNLFERVIISAEARAFIFIGLLGAFTTFSTYSLESVGLLRDGEVRQALVNLLLSNGAGLALTFAGIIVSRFMIQALR